MLSDERTANKTVIHPTDYEADFLLPPPYIDFGRTGDGMSMTTSVKPGARNDEN
jgi:hypothetical protein